MLRERFWERFSLEELSEPEWEALCDGCARCCMIKLQDEDSEEIVYTAVVCHLLDQDTCRCTSYEQRHRLVPDCIDFSASIVEQLAWLPKTCAYRKLAAGEPLEPWHPLLAGDPQAVHEAGVSVRGRVISEAGVPEEALEDMVVTWVET